MIKWRWLQKRAIRRWRKNWGLDVHYQHYQQICAPINGFALSKIARLNEDAIEFTYGEIEFEPFIALLSVCKPNQHTVFYDLGSGTGKAVLACAMVFNVQKCYGIELFSTLHQSAQAQQYALERICLYTEKARRIHFEQGNLLNRSLSDATLIFINASAFFGDSWLAICKHIEQVKPGCMVITTSKAIRSDHFIIIKTTLVQMSWGIVNAYIQQRLDD